MTDSAGLSHRRQSQQQRTSLLRRARQSLQDGVSHDYPSDLDIDNRPQSSCDQALLLASTSWHGRPGSLSPRAPQLELSSRIKGHDNLRPR